MGAEEYSAEAAQGDEDGFGDEGVVEEEAAEDPEMAAALAEAEAAAAEVAGMEGLDEELAEEALVEEDGAADEAADDEVGDDADEGQEGVLRLKRMLSSDTDGMPQKKLKAGMEAKINQLLMKYMMVGDILATHVLTDASEEELDALLTGVWKPSPQNTRNAMPEQIAVQLRDYRERVLPHRTGMDQVAAFKFKWKLNTPQHLQTLQGLTHKEIRYVLDIYDGETLSLAEVVAGAKSHEPDEISTETAIPDAPGLSTVGRFTRLELIDPVADSAVFGDANLTFSLKLAKHRFALGHVGRVIATTFEELDTLRERYKEIDDSIKTLESQFFCEVFHGVDCTQIQVNKQFEGLEGSLGAVYYNFPHSGAIGGFFDGHPVVNWRHENLMRLFFRALRTFVKPGGIVKVASSSGAVGVRYSYIVASALENEFAHHETMPFLEWHLHRYGRSYGDKRDLYKRPDAVNNQSYSAQSAHNDMVYCFVYKPSGESIGKQTVRLPPTLSVIEACQDGPFRGMQGPARTGLAQKLHKRFVTEISGVHVGD